MTPTDIENLSLLLTSIVDANVELGLELLKNNEDKISIFVYELSLLSRLHDNPDFMDIAQELLFRRYSHQEVFEYRRGIQLFEYVNTSIKDDDIKRLIKQFDDAFHLYNPLIKRNHHMASYYLKIAIKLGRKENFRLDAERFHELLDAIDNMHHSNLFHWAGVVAYDDNRYPEAIELYSKAVEIQPQDDTSIGNIGILCRNLGHYEKAYQYFKRAIACNTRAQSIYERSLASLCVFHLEGQNYKEEAKELLKTLTQKEPDFSPNWTGWANYLWVVENRYIDARNAYLKGLEFNPYNTTIMGNLGELYADVLHNDKKAKHWYEKAQRNGCSTYTLLNMMRYYILSLEDYKTGKKIYQELLQKNGNSINKKSNFLNTEQINKFEEAEIILWEKYPELKMNHRNE